MFLVAGLVFLSGCGAAPSAVSAYTVRASHIAGLGNVLTSGRGYTLYIYVFDAGRGQSLCTGPCAQLWPPLTLPEGVESAVAGHGVRVSLLGTTRRSDGTRQVTYHGWPLYFDRRDDGPGQENGQGDGMGAWWTISASGTVDRQPIAGVPGS